MERGTLLYNLEINENNFGKNLARHKLNSQLLPNEIL